MGIHSGMAPSADAPRRALGEGRRFLLEWPQEVMLARPVEALPSRNHLRGGCLYEAKWDGYRIVLHVGQDAGRQPMCRLQSRRGVDLTGAFPDLAAAAATQLPPGAVLDGEAVVWSGEGLDFTALQRRMVSPSLATRLAESSPPPTSPSISWPSTATTGGIGR